MTKRLMLAALLVVMTALSLHVLVVQGVSLLQLRATLQSPRPGRVAAQVASVTQLTKPQV